MNGVGDPRQGTGNWTEVEVECFALLAVSFYSLKKNSYRLLPVGIKIVIMSPFQAQRTTCVNS